MVRVWAPGIPAGEGGGFGVFLAEFGMSPIRLGGFGGRVAAGIAQARNLDSCTSKGAWPRGARRCVLVHPCAQTVMTQPVL